MRPVWIPLLLPNEPAESGDRLSAGVQDTQPGFSSKGALQTQEPRGCSLSTKTPTEKDGVHRQTQNAKMSSVETDETQNRLTTDYISQIES